MSEVSIFHGALEIADPQARTAYLDQACGNDVALRRRIEDLLQAHLMTTPFMSRPAADMLGAGAVPAGGRAGAVIAGRYTLVERIGEGGMGEVWVAEQTEPVNRRVAVKLIKPGMDSNAVIARFESERQALALMDHPNIAKWFDGGLTDRGRPFFVMELVNGLPLTRFCDEDRLTPRERLELFVPICQAVQHAHQKGIVHRDLKPSNILVTLYDGRPVPKVIDFGVAKATGGQLAESTLPTQFGAVVGTLEYMAPEQAGFNALDVDTRADVYSLGVILYELLTGLKPFDAARLHKSAIDEVFRIIREEEPPRPSTRLSTDESLPSLAAVRRTEPKRLTALMRGELDWVVMKCLEKDCSRRYETVNALSRDVQRFLADEPVEAHSPVPSYRLRKFVRRNRGPVMATALIVLALVGGIVGTTLGLFEAKQQEGLARHSAEEERNANARAQKRLGQLEDANNLLASIFENLDPRVIAKADRPLQAILVEKLDKAIKQLNGESIGDPLVVAALQDTFGTTLLGLGEPRKAIVPLEKAHATRQTALGPDHPDTLKTMNNLGLAYLDAGKVHRALALIADTLELRKATLGPKHPDTLISMDNLAAAYQMAGNRNVALQLLEETLKVMTANLGPDHPDTLTSMNNLGLAYRDAGKLDRALPLLEKTLKLMRKQHGPDHPDTLKTMNNLGLAYRDAGTPALAILEETLKLRKARLGPDHPDTLTSMHNLAPAYRDAGRRDLALTLLEETLKLRKAKLGPDHPDTLTSMNTLAVAHLYSGKWDLALPLLEKALDLGKLKLGPDHPNTLISMHNLALAYRHAGRRDLALPILEETLKVMTTILGPDHPDTLKTMNSLGVTFQGAGNFDRALPLLKEALESRKEKLGREHADTLTSMNNLAMAYWDAGKLDLALTLLEETLVLLKANAGLDHHSTLTAMSNLAQGYLEAEKVDSAVPLFKHLLARGYKPLPKDTPQLAGQLAAIGRALLEVRSNREAEMLLRDALVIHEKKQPDDWSTFDVRSMLGGAMLGQKKPAEAEPLLRAGYQGMRDREAKIPANDKPRLPEAVDRLVELYVALGKPDEVAKWRTERAKYYEHAPPPREHKP